MEQRQMAIEQLRDLYNKVEKLNSLSAKLEQTTYKINNAEKIIKQEKKVLAGSIEQKWEEVNYIKNEEDEISSCTKINETKAKRKVISFCIIGVLLNLAVFALSIMFLVNAPETSWIKTHEVSPLFWICHIVLGLGVVFTPIAISLYENK